MKRKTNAVGRKPLYPWAVWERARSFRLDGKDYRGAPHGMAQQIRNKFKTRYRVAVEISGRVLSVRLY